MKQLELFDKSPPCKKNYLEYAIVPVQELEKSCRELNLFIMNFEPNDSLFEATSNQLISELQTAGFASRTYDLSLADCKVPNFESYGPRSFFRAICISSKSIEKLRDVFKKFFWNNLPAKKATKNIIDFFQNQKKLTPKPFKLSDFGLFVPCRNKKHKETGSFTFDHSPFYRYRLATEKIKQLPKNFAQFLELVFEDCPNHLFQKNNFRASGQNFKLKPKITHTKKHEIIEYTQKSNLVRRFQSAHENVQHYFLEHDPCSITCELPVWIEEDEFKDYKKTFRTSSPLTGHIDLVRFEKDEKIGVWDYKPKARYEKTATTQVFIYAFMLSVRTGIPLKSFICGYFDDKDLYSFEPSLLEKPFQNI